MNIIDAETMATLADYNELVDWLEVGHRVAIRRDRCGRGGRRSALAVE